MTLDEAIALIEVTVKQNPDNKKQVALWEFLLELKSFRQIKKELLIAYGEVSKEMWQDEEFDDFNAAIKLLRSIGK